MSVDAENDRHKEDHSHTVVDSHSLNIQEGCHDSPPKNPSGAIFSGAQWSGHFGSAEGPVAVRGQPFLQLLYYTKWV